MDPQFGRAALAASRRHRGVSLVRLQDDFCGAGREPIHIAGSVVEARWVKADHGFVAGWQVEGCGFCVRLADDEVEVVERA